MSLRGVWGLMIRCSLCVLLLLLCCRRSISIPASDLRIRTSQTDASGIFPGCARLSASDCRWEPGTGAVPDFCGGYRMSHMRIDGAWDDPASENAWTCPYWEDRSLAGDLRIYKSRTHSRSDRAIPRSSTGATIVVLYLVLVPQAFRAPWGW
ncbi:hypothetical protein EV426DRAFT_571466 [Tirmania nivea]|nr:hypothetical protein EV426DRAFT_571466 [Tirmania nivea]